MKTFAKSNGPPLDFSQVFENFHLGPAVKFGLLRCWVFELIEEIKITCLQESCKIKRSPFGFLANSRKFTFWFLLIIREIKITFLEEFRKIKKSPLEFSQIFELFIWISLIICWENNSKEIELFFSKTSAKSKGPPFVCFAKFHFFVLISINMLLKKYLKKSKQFFWTTFANSKGPPFDFSLVFEHFHLGPAVKFGLRRCWALELLDFFGLQATNLITTWYLSMINACWKHNTQNEISNVIVRNFERMRKLFVLYLT